MNASTRLKVAGLVRAASEGSGVEEAMADRVTLSSEIARNCGRCGGVGWWGRVRQWADNACWEWECAAWCILLSMPQFSGWWRGLCRRAYPVRDGRKDEGEGVWDREVVGGGIV